MNTLLTWVDRRRAVALGAATLLVAALVTAAVRSDSGDRTGVRSSRSATTQATGDNPTAAIGDAASTEPGAGGGGGTTAGGSGSRSATGAQRAVGAPDGGPASAPVARPTLGDVQIGIEYDHDNSAAYKTIGAKGVATGDQRGEITAVVNWINSHGGLGGHKLVPVLHESNAETSPFAAQAQAACADFTEDHHVAAVVGRTSDRDDLYRCLARKRVPFVAQNRYLWDQKTLAAGADTLYAPGSLGGGRWDKWVDALARTGFFTRRGGLGVVRFDTPAYERTYKEVVEPAIRRHGAKVASEVTIHQPESVANFGGMNGELANAVLRLRSAQVDHVIILDEGTITFFLLPQAESQNWHPVWGLHSQNLPQVLSVNAHAAQLKNAVGAGWVPSLDVDFAQDPGATPGVARCLSIYRAAGMRFDDRVAQSFALRYCDSLLFLKATFDRTQAVNLPALRAAAEAIGSAHESALTFRAVIGPGRHDGAEEMRPFRFEDGCRCFRYS